MKSIASFILAAVVSANYCYTDGCNCNGARRACYSLPRQNMRPAVNTCCPVGVQPTIYGFDNGRSINITPVTDSLWSNKKQQEMLELSQGGSSTAQSQTSSLRRRRNKKKNLRTRRNVKKNASSRRRNVNKKNDSWNGNSFTGANIKTGGNTNCGANCGITVNVDRLNHAMSGGSSATWSPTARLNADCAATFQARQCAQVFQARGCRQLGLGNARKECEKNAGDVRKECEKNAADVRKECEKGAVDAPMETQEPKQVDFSESEEAVAVERNQGDCAAIFQARQCAQVFQARGCRQLGLGQARKECEKNAGDARKECEKNAGDARKECEKAQVSNLQVYGGGNPNTRLAKLDEWPLYWSKSDCRRYCQQMGAYPDYGCGMMTATHPSQVEYCVPVSATASLFSAEHKEKMGKTDGSWNPRDSLAWNADKCSAYCASFGSYPPTKCTRYGPCEVAPAESTPVEAAQTSNLAPCNGGYDSWCR